MPLKLKGIIRFEIQIFKMLKPFKNLCFTAANSLEHHWKLFGINSEGFDTSQTVFEKLLKMGKLGLYQKEHPYASKITGDSRISDQNFQNA